MIITNLSIRENEINGDACGAPSPARHSKFRLLQVHFYKAPLVAHTVCAVIMYY